MKSKIESDREKQHLKELMARSAALKEENKLTKNKLEDLKRDTDEMLSEQRSENTQPPENS